MKKRKKRPRQLIGRREQVDFPELGLFNITAKVDTGAYTSALHCHEIKEQNKLLYFTTEKVNGELISHQTESFFQKDIKNSFGETEKRYIITTRIKIGGRTIKCLISLTNRGQMNYPVLIGRRILKNKFIVDVAQLDIASQAIKFQLL